MATERMGDGGHTPGPWAWLSIPFGYLVVDREMREVTGERLEDARLISAAPELLATLEAVERRLARTDGFDGTKEIIRAAIAKARGAA